MGDALSSLEVVQNDQNDAAKRYCLQQIPGNSRNRGVGSYRPCKAEGWRLELREEGRLALQNLHVFDAAERFAGDLEAQPIGVGADSTETGLPAPHGEVCRPVGAAEYQDDGDRQNGVYHDQHPSNRDDH